MKKLLFLLFAASAVCLISCNDPLPTQEELKALEEKAFELRTFLTDNYTEGDSIFFQRETGEIEGFVVKANYFDRLDESRSPEGYIGEFYTVTPGYKLRTYLKSAENALDVMFSCSRNNKKIYVDGMCRIRNEEHSYDELPICQTTIGEDTIRITTGEIECILIKNIGIVKIAENQNTWGLVQR
jgi:hypothetical protein